MAVVLVQLPKGLQIGEDLYKEAEIRELTAADIFAAQEESERLVFAPNQDGHMEPQMVTSPARFGQALLRRQLVRIGQVQAKDISPEVFGRLHSLDLAALEGAANDLEQAALASIKRTTERGRDDEVGAAT